MNVATKTASIIQLALSTTIIIPSKLKKLTHQRDNALNKTQFETIIEHLLTYLRCLFIIFSFCYFLITRLTFLIFFVCLFASFVYLFSMLYILCFCIVLCIVLLLYIAAYLLLFIEVNRPLPPGGKPNCSK